MSSTQVPPVSRPTRRGPALAPRSPQQGRFLLLGGLWALSVLALTALTYKRFFATPGGVLTDPDAMDFAQIARNMAQGHGYATGVLRPLAVTGFAPPDANNVAPDVSRAPLYPFLLMLVSILHGRNLGDTLVVTISLMLFLGTVFAVYRLARTLFPALDQIGIALLAAGLYGVGGELLGYSVLGLPTALATLMVTLLFIALYRAAETPGRPAGVGSAVAVGVLLGLCYLAQYSLLLLAVPALVYLFFTRAPQRSWPAVGACALGFFAITGVWLVRNAHLSHGNPFFTLLFYGIMDNTDAYPGVTTIYRSTLPDVSLLTYFFSHLPDMLTRVGRGLTFYRDNLLHAFNVFLLAAAIASLIWRAPDARQNALRGYAAFCLLTIILVTALFEPSVQMIVPFSPLVTVIAIGFVFRTAAEQGWDAFLQRLAIWSLALLVCLGALVQFNAAPVPVTGQEGNGLQALDGNGIRPPGQAVICDAPWEVAWRTGVSGVWLPGDKDNTAYDAVASLEGDRLRGVLLTPRIENYNLPAGEALPWYFLLHNPLALDNKIKLEHDNTKLILNLIKKHDPLVAAYTPDNVPQMVSGIISRDDPAYGECLPISDVLRSFEVANPSNPLILENLSNSNETSYNGTSCLLLKRNTPLAQY